MPTYCILDSNNVVQTTFANSQLPTTQTGYTEIPVDGGQIGQTWDGTAFVLSLATAQATALAALSAATDSARAQMAYLGYTVTLGPQDIIDAQGTIAMLTAQPAGTTIQWNIAAGTWLTWQLSDVQDAYSAGLAHIAACYANAYTLMQQINAATTVAEVQAVNINSGWPT